MKALKTIIALTLCIFALPALAGDGNDNKEIRKEKRRFTKEVRSMKGAKNYKEKRNVEIKVAKGKF